VRLNYRSVWGDGIVSPDEDCDDSKVIDGDGCDTNGPFTDCGNSIITTGETCDDGNPLAGDGCDANCAIEPCGNDIFDLGEECDDGTVFKMRLAPRVRLRCAAPGERVISSQAH
jgi:cysteine-rich repeat protein